MEPLARYLPCLLVLGSVSACGTRGPAKDMSLQELLRERDRLLSEQDEAAINFARWHVHQNDAARVLMMALRIDVGPVYYKRPPSEILQAQRDGVKALIGDVTLTDEVKSRWLSKWHTYQRQAAETIARPYGKSPEEGAGPIDLLDVQEKSITLLIASLDESGRESEKISAEIERSPPPGWIGRGDAE